MSLKLSERPCFRRTSTSTYSTSLQVRDFLLTFHVRDASCLHSTSCLTPTSNTSIIPPSQREYQHQHQLYIPLSTFSAPVPVLAVHVVSTPAPSPAIESTIAPEPAICITPNRFNTSPGHFHASATLAISSFTQSPAAGMASLLRLVVTNHSSARQLPEPTSLNNAPLALY